jgi:Mg2+-importing ATPase
VSQSIVHAPVSSREPSDRARRSPRDAIAEAARIPIERLLDELGTSPLGLAAEEAAERLEIHGPNRVAQEGAPPWYAQLYRAFSNPFNILLLGLAAISFATGDREATAIIAVMVALSASLRFTQELRSSVAAEKLRTMVKVTATIVRPAIKPTILETPIESLVPGDVVQLSAGDMVPADVRLLTSKDLFISQAVLTGEALPVEKDARTSPDPKMSALEAPNLCFLGTNVMSGAASAVVVATGPKTYLGSLARSLTKIRVETSFDKGVRAISYLLMRFSLGMALLVFVLNGAFKHDWWEAFLFAVSIAVGLTPEMLPMIVSGALAIGAVTMSKKKVVVKRINSIQNIGAIDILCTDKTGTLTQDKVILEHYRDVGGDESEDVLRYAYLNSYYQTGLKNLLDQAILAHREIPVSVDRKIDEIPFDFARRMMSVVIDDGHTRQLITKGAPEAVFERCTHFELGGEILAIDELFLPDLKEEVDRLGAEGFRVLAIAYKDVDQGRETFSRDDEHDLIMKGYVAFLDPPKETAVEAIAALRTHGVSVKVLTGDNDLVTRNVCRHVGLPSARVVLGHEVQSMDDAMLASTAEAETVFARLTPTDKERIVSALRSRGHAVGFLGDGINDAPALRAADVGISVDNAVDIAKESADLILLEKSLLVLEDGVLEGRRVFANIIKYIKMGASSNFGNTFSVLGASVFLPFLPMMPIQLLVQNLLYDFSQLGIPFDTVDEEYLALPRKWRIDEIGRFMVFIGPLSSIFDYTTFVLMFYVFGANTLERAALFHSGWFVEGLLSQTLIVHMIRTRKIPFIQSRPAPALLFATAVVMAIGIALPFTPIGASVGLVPLPPPYFAWLAATLAAYAVLMQLVKTTYARRYGFI